MSAPARSDADTASQLVRGVLRTRGTTPRRGGVVPRASAGSMRKASRREDDDSRPEYDFSSSPGGVRGK